MKNSTRLATSILGLPFSVVLQTDNVMAADTTDIEPNNTIGAAQNINHNSSVGVNPDVLF